MARWQSAHTSVHRHGSGYSCHLFEVKTKCPQVHMCPGVRQKGRGWWDAQPRAKIGTLRGFHLPPDRALHVGIQTLTKLPVYLLKYLLVSLAGSFLDIGLGSGNIV